MEKTSNDPFTHSVQFWGTGEVQKWRYGSFVRGSHDFPIYLHIEAEKAKMFITWVKMVQMTSYLHHNIISRRQTFPEVFVKIRHDDAILRHITSFSYIFPYYDVIDINADVSENNDVIVKVIIANKRTNVTL